MPSGKKVGAILVVLFWLAVLPVGGFFALKFMGNTVLDYHPPKDSIVGRAQATGGKYFTTQILHDPLYLLFETIGEQSGVLPITDPFYQLEDLSHALRHQLETNRTYWREVISIHGYYLEPLPQMAARFSGNDNQSSLILIDLNNGILHMKPFHKKVEATVNEFMAVHNLTDKLSYRTTSIEQISADLQNGILGDLVRIDGITFPFAVATLAYCLKSVRMLVIPMIAVPVTFCTALGLMYPVSLKISVSSFAPELSAAVMIAVTTDYSLFILSRFNEQVRYQEAKFGDRSEATRWAVVSNTAKLSAENIMVSGLTIAAALGGLAVLPVGFLATIGIAFGIACVSAVFISLTLMPSLLFVFYEFFRVPTTIPKPILRALSKCCCCGSKKNGGADDDDSSSNEKKRLTRELELSPMEQHHSTQREQMKKSPWFKMGRFAFRHPFLLALAVCLLGSPFFYLASTVEVDFNLFNQVPRSSPHGNTLKAITTTIGDGQAIPFYVVIDSGSPGGLMNNSVFAFTLDLITALKEESGQPMDRVNCWCHVENRSISTVEEMKAAMELFPAYKVIFNATVDALEQVGLLLVSPTFDPFSTGANDYLSGMNDAILSTLAKHKANLPVNLTAGFMGSSAESWAIMHTVMKYFPMQVGITFGIIFVFIGVVFRSVFIPLRMIFTVAYTVAGAFGVGVLFFQYSWSHVMWTAMAGVHSYVWLVPIMSFSLLCALALDYDVFLVTRIIELKRIGFNDEAAISKGVWKTGRIISFAGVIMAISFGSLMLSNVTLLNQFGMVATSAVLVDTFLIRPLFTPALMSTFPRLSWWPRNFTGHLEVEDMDEMPEEDGAAGDGAEAQGNKKKKSKSGAEALNSEQEKDSLLHSATSPSNAV